jgi:pimeloyl-ACP methyl ester carboxylesterase
MARLLAIVSAIMLIGGATVGILALGSASRLEKGDLLQGTVAVAGAGSVSSEDTAASPVFDIPKLDKITIDGSPNDWGGRGLRVSVLANASGKIQPKSDIDANLRLGWNDKGLLALITVTDDIALEDTNPGSGDSVELFVAPRVGASDVLRVAIGPGVDPKQPHMRLRIFDQRTDPRLKKIAPRVSAGRTKIAGGYIIEALIPWANFGIKPQMGRELGFQLQVNDLDAMEQGSHLVWYPSIHTVRDPSKMQRLRLAAAPGDIVQVAAYGDYPRFHRTRITVAGDATLVNKTVEIVRPARSVTPTEPRLVATGKLEPDFIRPELASLNVSLPMPARSHPFGVLEVLVDGKPAGVVDLPDPGNAARWILPYQDFVFKPCVFSTRAFPEGDFEDPSYVEDIVGSYETKITFYDTDMNVVTTAEKPGRYGAVVEVRTEDGQTFKRFRTLFREPQDFNWRNTDIPFTVKFPKEMGISAGALRIQQHSVSTYFKELLKDEGVNRDADTAVLLAGLFETKPTDRSLLSNSPAAIDRAWWAALKRKTGEPVIRHLIYLPVGYEKDTNKKWPLILFLHGKGERGDNLDQIKEAALPSRLEYDHHFREKFPAIVVAPQCPAGSWWSSHELAALLDEVQAKYRVDADRVYVTGMSMGGYGTWALATEFPDRFAAIAPVCGGGDVAEANRLVGVPIWAFHGNKDNVVPFSESQQMVAALQGMKGNVRFTVYPDSGHDAWTETYGNPELYTWLLSHARYRPAAPKAPLLAATPTPTTLQSSRSH